MLFLSLKIKRVFCSLGGPLMEMGTKITCVDGSNSENHIKGPLISYFGYHQVRKQRSRYTNLGMDVQKGLYIQGTQSHLKMGNWKWKQ